MVTSMSLSLNPNSLQRLHEALVCLSKFSESVTWEAFRNRLCLSVLNSSRSGYVGLTFDTRFFDAYALHTPVVNTHSRRAAGKNAQTKTEDSSVACRFPIKALLAVFRARGGGGSGGDGKDKNREGGIERCEVEIVEGTGGSESQRRRSGVAECRLRVRMFCKHGVLKIYKLAYEDADAAHALFDESTALNRWSINSRMFREYMEHFGPRTEQLDISVQDDRATFTSFTEKLVDGSEVLKAPLHTSVSLSTVEFDEFSVEEGLHLSISVKDFRNAVQYADLMNVPISVLYSVPMRPVLITFEREGLNARFILMSRGTDVGASQSTVGGRISRAGSERRVVSGVGRERERSLATELASREMEYREYQPTQSTPRGLFTPSAAPSDVGDRSVNQMGGALRRQSGPQSTAGPGTATSSQTMQSSRPQNEEPLFFEDSDEEIQPSAMPAKGLLDSDGSSDELEQRIEWDPTASNASGMRAATDRVRENGRGKRRRDSDAESTREGGEAQDNVVEPTQALPRGLLDLD